MKVTTWIYECLDGSGEPESYMPMQVGNHDETQKPIDLNAFKRRNRIGQVSNLVIALLLVQLLMGMWSNLFVTFPSQTPSVNPLDSVLLNGPFIVTAHIVNGILLGILSILAMALSVVARNRRAIFLSCCGFVSILFAGESGIIFALGWYTNNYLSFSMTTGFTLSLLVYFLLSVSFAAGHRFNS